MTKTNKLIEAIKSLGKVFALHCKVIFRTVYELVWFGVGINLLRHLIEKPLILGEGTLAFIMVGVWLYNYYNYSHILR